MYKYQPKRPVKSFQDLSVYQTTYNLAITIQKAFPPTERTVLSQITSSIPRLIVVAHSIRFADPQKAIANLEQAMLNCNLAVHYLSLKRDMETDAKKQKQDRHRGDQLQKDYLTVRRKILNLQRSWQKFMGINKLNQNA
jgi:hypothetical protein